MRFIFRAMSQRCFYEMEQQEAKQQKLNRDKAALLHLSVATAGSFISN